MATFPSDRCPTCHRKHKRTHPQNARYWALLHECAAKLADGKFSAEHFHLYYRSRFLGCTDYTLPNGKTLSIPRSTTDCDIAEFSAYMDQVEADAAQRGVFLADLETA